MYIIYTKSGCKNCDSVKTLLSREEKIIIDCDYLVKNNRTEFIKSIELKTRVPFKQFPIIFYNDSYIGGYNELVEHLNFELVEDF